MTSTRPSDTSQSEHERSERHAHSKARARQQFDKWSLTYDRSLLNQVVFYPSVRACQEQIVRWQRGRAAHEGGPPPYHVLDVGCGTGTLLSILYRDPAAERLVGLDFSASMVSKVAGKIEQGGLNDRMHVVCADSERLPFADASFDVLTCCNSFHHYPHQAAVVREFHRVLRPGGVLVLIDGFRDNVIGWVIFDVFVTGIEKHVHHASWSEFRTMLEEAGFSQVNQHKHNILAPLLVNVALR